MSNKECPTCLDEYDTDRRRIRVLNCGHAQCTSCLEAQFTNMSITCCICRSTHTYPAVSSIPVNYTAETLMRDHSALIVPKLHKGVCDDHGQHKLFKCTTHNVWICPTCCLVEHPCGECEIISIKIQLENEKKITNSNISDELKLLDKTVCKVKQFRQQLDGTIKDEMKLVKNMAEEMNKIKKAIAKKEENIAGCNAKQLKMQRLTEDCKNNQSALEAIKEDLEDVATFKDLGKKKMEYTIAKKKHEDWKQELDQESKFDDNILPMIKTSMICFLTLSYKGASLGRIKIELTSEYPRRTQQFLDLTSGSRGGATWRGATFNEVVEDHNQPGEYLSCGYYITGTGHAACTALYEVEEAGPDRTPCEGEVQGEGGQWAGFYIITKSGGSTCTEPVIGRVIEGLPILQVIVSKGDAYAGAVTFTECGVTL